MLLAMFVTCSAFAQNRQISGTVKDSNGEPVIGAAVLVPNTTNGTSTDVDGRFTLSVPENTLSLEVSAIGYASSTVTLGTASDYSIVLREDTTFLDEVVVVGYGVQKKINVTGSVSSVSFDSESIKSRPMFNASQALSGTMPGLQVMQGSGNPYEEDFSMLVRGTGTLNSSGPLVLVDGMEQGLGNVNPSDIASINVLKDAASCAIYGNRGANGVILTTSRSRLSTRYRTWQATCVSTMSHAPISAVSRSSRRTSLTSGLRQAKTLGDAQSQAITIIWHIRTLIGGTSSIRTR